MKRVLSAMATAAYLLHALLGCAMHAHAGQDRCADHAAIHDHSDSHQDHDESQHSQNDLPQTPDSNSHPSDCAFGTMVKVDVIKHRLLGCTAICQPCPELPGVGGLDFLAVDVAAHSQLFGLRPHLAKSVLLI